MSFLWNTFIELAISVILFGGLFWTSIKISMNARVGETVSKQERFWICIVIATVILSGINTWIGHDLLNGITLAFYSMGIFVDVAAIIAIILFTISFRKTKMEEAYRQYDALLAAGKNPCLITSSLFGPKVLGSYPPMMRTGMLMWSEKGQVRCYATTTQERLNRALRAW